MWAFILRYPMSSFTALFIHLIVVAGFVYSSFSQPEAVKVSLDIGEEETISPKVKFTEPLRTFAVDSAIVQKQLALLKEQEQTRQDERQKLEQQTAEEKKHLASLERQQQVAKKKAEEQRKKAEVERRKADESRRIAEAEKQKVVEQRKRVAEETHKAEQAQKAASLAEKQRQEADLRVIEAKKQREDEEARTKKLQAEIQQRATEKERLERQALIARMQREQEEEEASLQRQLAAEEAGKRAKVKEREIANLKEVYISSISAKVRGNWRTAARISPNAACDIKVVQTNNRDIISVNVLNCTAEATEQFKRDAERATLRSSPLPKPPYGVDVINNITFRFVP